MVCHKCGNFAASLFACARSIGQENAVRSICWQLHITYWRTAGSNGRQVKGSFYANSARTQAPPPHFEACPNLIWSGRWGEVDATSHSQKQISSERFFKLIEHAWFCWYASLSYQFQFKSTIVSECVPRANFLSCLNAQLKYWAQHQCNMFDDIRHQSLADAADAIYLLCLEQCAVDIYRLERCTITFLIVVLVLTTKQLQYILKFEPSPDCKYQVNRAQHLTVLMYRPHC